MNVVRSDFKLLPVSLGSLAPSPPPPPPGARIYSEDS